MTAMMVTGTPSLHATFCLLVDQFPIAVSALCILFRLCRVIERKLDVMKGRSSLSSKTATLWPLEVTVSLTGCVRK